MDTQAASTQATIRKLERELSRLRSEADRESFHLFVERLERRMTIKLGTIMVAGVVSTALLAKLL